MKAMQSINVEAPTPWFMLGFMGPAVVCVVAIVVAVLHWDEAYARVPARGSRPVPRRHDRHHRRLPRASQRRARRDRPASPEAERAWDDYAAPWTKWNHVRVLAGLVASGLYVAALYVACP